MRSPAPSRFFQDFVSARIRVTPIDALLLLMAIIWGTNYSIVKRVFAEIDPQAFNAVRMTIASLVFLTFILAVRVRPQSAAGALAGVFYTPAAMTRRDWLGLAGLGIVGHFLYQYFFIGGLALTSVANSSLMLAATPVVIALVSAALGQERVSALHWAGAALSVAGIYAVVGRVAPGGGSRSIVGDAMMFGAVCCWAIYTLGARQLMVRHSPVGVTGLSMAIGTALYVPVMLIRLGRVDWISLSRGTWLAILYSAIFALCIAYTIWYAAVREIGSARTSVYSNLVPIVAMLTAVVFLGEPLNGWKIFGAAAVLAGVGLTRVRGTTVVIPTEE
jgi:drug/metabolite transporter (DMT)-like permease